METETFLKLSRRICELNQKLIDQLKQGAEPSRLKKDLNLQFYLSERLITIGKRMVKEQLRNSSSIAADKTASAVH